MQVRAQKPGMLLVASQNRKAPPTRRSTARLTHRTPGKRKARVHKPRHPRCDCGQLAVTVVTRRVGCNPQYIIHLPLCRDCLALEQTMQRGD